MRRNSTFTIFLFAGLFIGALAVFGIVLKQRFNGSDVQPRYSTLRADPLGAKALYDALDLLPGIVCKRNYRPLEKLSSSKGSALILLNVNPSDIGDQNDLDGEAIQRFAAGGGRVVITLDSDVESFWKKVDQADRKIDQGERKSKKAKAKEEPAKKPAASEPEHETEKEKEPVKEKEVENAKKPKAAPAKPAKAKDDQKGERELPFAPKRSLSELLKFIAVEEPYKPESKGGINLTWDASLPLDENQRPKWNSACYFKLTGSAEENARWHVLASLKGKAMIMERTIGGGSIVVSSDGFFVTNESLKMEPKTQFLSWLMAGARDVVFDETHLGVNEEANIMTLARRNHLHGLFYGGLLLFALFVWRSGMSLVPHREDDFGSNGTIAGHGATAGLVSLLRRGIKPSQLLARCVESWQKSHASRSAATAARMEEAKKTLAEEEAKSRWQRKNAAAYEKICAMIHSKGS
jgi:hypothetical protein